MLQRSICMALNRTLPCSSLVKAAIIKHYTGKYTQKTLLAISQYTSNCLIYKGYADFHNKSLRKRNVEVKENKCIVCEDVSKHLGKYVEMEGYVYQDENGYLVLKDKTGTVDIFVTEENLDLQKIITAMKSSHFKVIGIVIKHPQPETEDSVGVLIDNMIPLSPAEEVTSLKSKTEEEENFFQDSKEKEHNIMKCDDSFLYLHPTEESKCVSGSITQGFFKRSHSCNVSSDLIGKKVTLFGWVGVEPNRKSFFILQDGYGSVPVVFDKKDVNLSKDIKNLKPNMFVLVKGVVYANTVKQKSKFGNDVHISSTSFEVINGADAENNKSEEINETEAKKLQDESDVCMSEGNGRVLPDINKYTKRSHTCGELDENHIGQKVKLMGWVEFLRMNRFILLRDKYGSIQLTLPISGIGIQDKFNDLQLGSVICAEGTVCARPPGQENKYLKSGTIEVVLTNLEVINTSKTLPFTSKSKGLSKLVQLRYRYLDLRQNAQSMANLKLRCNVIQKMRRYLIDHVGFLEVETPTLFGKTPGGAQEFVVPTRNKGEFYSLVQSPQQFKQLLMVGSVDRYFQIARCYRDETSRSDRQPEFTQLDIEMSFCDREGVINLIEDILKFVWPKDLGSISTPFPRISYHDAMKLYGSDKPDLRIKPKICDLTKYFINEKNKWSEKLKFHEFATTNYNFSAHGLIAKKAMNVFKPLKNFAKEKAMDAKCSILTLPVVSKGRYNEILADLFADGICKGIKESVECEEEDVVFLCYGDQNSVLKVLGDIRFYMSNCWGDVRKLLMTPCLLIFSGFWTFRCSRCRKM
ncbi:UNVERIFIED_CONTAM: hypothetical protein PYX00_006304 [Menopon gallinae]|uniref:Aminoacyl-transfer RNA synthetases class-II family profile domain-containing protein n=1 Tax=Menopon gallinae TaxID=328185 RepID=A0AAW2HUJ5_9NEOP